jgi:hypothetical protein
MRTLPSWFLPTMKIRERICCRPPTHPQWSMAGKKVEDDSVSKLILLLWSEIQAGLAGGSDLAHEVGKKMPGTRLRLVPGRNSERSLADVGAIGTRPRSI